MTRVKILGAGSIGNHLSNAARAKGWQVTLCDIDPAALERTRKDIYPGRYGAWDDSIQLAQAEELEPGGHDWIFIGTPPDAHVPLALDALGERPKGILVEKPFATPGLEDCQTLFERAKEAGIRVFVGYDHVVAKSVVRFTELAKALSSPQTLDLSFREHWQGIFKAHPWLEGPSDTYLGYWKRGGGALGEHSHALNLWQSIAHSIGAGPVVEVTASLDYVQDHPAEYDRLALLNLRTKHGLVGRVVQDVVTRPAIKSARLQGVDSAIEWQCIPAPYADVVRNIGEDVSEEWFEKKRPDDFIQELDHLEAALTHNLESPISIERGLDSMLVIAAAHLSARSGRRVDIDYSKGYVPGALVAA